MDEKPEFSQIGGVRLDFINLTWPFAKIKVYHQKIEFNCLFKSYLLNKNQILSLREHEGILSKGLCIEHSKPGYPHHMVFWTFGLNELKTKLENVGFSIGKEKEA